MNGSAQKVILMAHFAFVLLFQTAYAAAFRALDGAVVVLRALLGVRENLVSAVYASECTLRLGVALVAVGMPCAGKPAERRLDFVWRGIAFDFEQLIVEVLSHGVECRAVRQGAGLPCGE